MDLHDIPRRLTLSKQLTLNFFWFALNFQSAALLPVVVPAQILLFVPAGTVGNAQQATFLGWLSTVGALIALLVPPLVGMMSDHTPGTLGRRRPYILIGTPLLLLGAFLLASANQVWLFVLGFAVLQVAGNGGTAAYQSLLPDLVPERQRGEASGYVGLMTIFGNVGSLALAAWLLGQVTLGSSADTAIRQGANYYYLISGVVLLAGALVTVIYVHEAPFSLALTEPIPARAHALLRLRHWVARNWLAP